MIGTPIDNFEIEVRRRLGITANEFLARIKYNDLADFSQEEIEYLLILGKDEGRVSDD